MAPIRKSRNLNMLSSKDSKDSPIKDAGNGNKTWEQKRKVPDMLGCKWTKEELGRFYEAYRKYGKNWKKVASVIHGRSVDMVEALYNMNKAYLSLPDGIASVVGLLAMMTDHYNSLDSDESESDEEPKISQKVKRHARGNSRAKVVKSSAGHVPDMLHSQAVASSYGCLSLLKNRCSSGSGPRIVKKRTPRVPLSHPNSEEDVNDKEVAQGALALTEVLQRGGSSQTPNRRTGHRVEAEMVRIKHNGAAKGNCWETNLGIRNTGNANSARDGVNTVEVGGKRKRFPKIKPNLQDTRSDHSVVKKTRKISKRSGQLLSKDESFALDALNILADSHPKLEPTSIVGSGSKENGENHTITGDDSALNVGLISGAKQRVHQPTSRMKKRKCKSLLSKIPIADSPINSLSSKQPKTERKSVGPQKPDSSRGDLPRQGNSLTLPVVKVPSVNQVNLLTKLRSKRKMDLQNKVVQNRKKFPEYNGNGQSNDPSSSLHDRAHSLMEKFSHCLSSQTLRRWCAIEWFYSAIDYPWFAKREFVEYLNHVGLGHVPKLTRVEWGVIRSSLGKPRRLSQQFLKEEKNKLEQYRESVRTHYTQLESGSMEAIPSDLARPLQVGQHVITRHPKTRGICDGRILTVERDKYRVQFDRLQLGVELVMGDTIDDASQDKATTSKSDTAQEVTHTQPCCSGQVQSRDADIQALSDLSCALDKKEALVLELRYMNCEILKKQIDADESLKNSELFKKRYTSVLMQLRETNDQVSSALLYLRQHNTCQEISPCPWLKPVTRSSGPAEPHTYFDHFAVPVQESVSNVVEVVEISRWKARTMVEAAAHAMSFSKEGEDVYTKIGEALDITKNRNFGVDSSIPAMRSFNPSNLSHHVLPYQNQATSGVAEQSMIDQTTDIKPNNASEVMKLPIPSALISSCVATLLMIQTCTDRQYPPAEAVEILDSAIRSLQPGCSQNIPIFRDIQMCMGMVKNQMLALIPT